MTTKRIPLALLIDDSDIDLFVQKRFIEITQFAERILTYRSPADALKFMDGLTPAELPQVIFLDLNMPGMDGFGFLERCTPGTKPGFEKIKIVVLTSSNNIADRERANSFANVISFVSKPLNSKLLEDLRNMLG
ncbi:MAG: response regulator [Cyclobacteriaceae bacterium]|nr:response regulator [Cyclobacteriaceae bacterium]